MSLRSQIISKLLADSSSRESYLRAKLNQIIPSQIKALRLRETWTQKELGEKADMKQARISAMEKPGETAFTLETLIRLAAAFRVGLQIKFVPFSEMLRWDNDYSQDAFTVTPIERDAAFIDESRIKSVSIEAPKNAVPKYIALTGALGPVQITNAWASSFGGSKEVSPMPAIYTENMRMTA